MTRSMGMEFIAGKTAESMRAIGISESSMDLDCTLFPKRLLSPSPVSGKTGKGSNGSLRRHRRKLIRVASTISSTTNCLRIRRVTSHFNNSINPMTSKKVGLMSI